MVVITKAEFTVRVNDFVAEARFTSETWMVKFAVAAAVGVPFSCPLDEFNVIPAGRVPADTLQVSGAVPPVAASVCE